MAQFISASQRYHPGVIAIMDECIQGIISAANAEAEAHRQKNQKKLDLMMKDLNFYWLIAGYSQGKISQNVAVDIKRGEALNEIKNVVDELPHKWEEWADKNIPLDDRVRQKLMRTAKAEFEPRWYKLGSECLNRICKTVKPYSKEVFCINMLMDAVVKRCGGDDVFKDKDPRLEKAVEAIFNTCMFRRESPQQFADSSRLYAACENGLKFSPATAENFNTLSDGELNRTLSQVIATSSKVRLRKGLGKGVNVRGFLPIHQDLKDYCILYMSGATGREFDVVKAAEMILWLHEMIQK